jgi:AraC family transcriptional regulator
MSSTPLYESHLDFYQAEYGAYIRRIRALGPITMIEVFQTPGDFSDKATGDLQIIRMLSRARCHTDFSAGKTSRWHAPGSLSVNPARFANSIVVDQSHRVDVASISWAALGTLDVDRTLPADCDFGAVHRSLIDDRAMNRVFDRLWSADVAADGIAAESAEVWIARRLVDWARAPAVPEHQPAEKLSPRALALSMDRLSTPGPQVGTLSELAALCRLSPYHFCRAFRASTGLPPHRWRIMRRLEQARELLRTTSLPVAEIGTAVGYDDPAYFARLFAQESGCSPRRWRDEARS